MHASARPYAIAGLALLTSSMIAVPPAMSPAGLPVASMDVRLVDADSLLTDVTGALGGIDPLSSLGGLSLPDLGSLDLGGLIGGAILTEQVFSLPGLGKLAVDAIGRLDLPIILGVTMLAGFFIIAANFLVDLLYAVIDPRVRLS